MHKDVFMIHGAFAGPWYFEPLLPLCAARGWRVTLATLPGHTGNDPGDDNEAVLAGLGLRDYQGALRSRLAAFEEPPVILGHSLGGLLAQQMAAEGLARACVAITPAAPWGITPTSPSEISAALGLCAIPEFWKTVIHPVFDVASVDSLDGLEEADRRAIFDRFGPESGRLLFELLFWAHDLTRASHVEFKGAACPALFIATSNDKLAAPDTVRKSADQWGKNAEFRVLNGFSHFLIGEPGWEKAITPILDWIERLS